MDTAAQTLAATKLRPPALPDHRVPRPRLDALLDQGVDARLVLVSAPDGSGESTVLPSWLRGRTEACAWLQEESRHSDEQLSERERGVLRSCRRS